jgi:hypothetical protein
MPKITLVHTTPGRSSSPDVPDEVKQDIEDTYAAMLANPGLEANVEFDTENEAKLWVRQVRSYCASREAGALKFRLLPSKHLDATMRRFSLKLITSDADDTLPPF